MANVTVAVAEPAVAPVAVIVTVAEDAAVGVPLMTPVDELIDRPAGSVPLVTANDTAPVKLLGVKAAEAVNDSPAVPDRLCDEGEIEA